MMKTLNRGASRGVWVLVTVVISALLLAGLAYHQKWNLADVQRVLRLSKSDPTQVVRDPPAVQTADAAASALATSASAPAAATSQADPGQTATPAQAPAVEPAVEPESFRFDRGNTASGRFGKRAKEFCDFNKIANCNKVKAGVDYMLPPGLKPNKAELKPRVRQASQPAARATVPAASAGIRLYEEVGRAPLRDCGRMSPVESSERAWVRAGLSEEDKVYLRARIDPKGPRRNITQKEGLYFIPKGMVLPFVTFCRGGDVVAVGPMLSAWKDGKSVPSERFVLPSGKAMAWMWECNNWVPVPAPEKERPPLPPGPPQEPPPSLPPEKPGEPPPPSTPPGRMPPEEEVVLQKYDWDAGVYAGGDRDVLYAGGEAAFYPALWHRSWGRYALGVGGFGNLWNGETSQGYAFRGHYEGIGLAQKWSTYERRDLGVKFPMIGALHERGGNGAFREERRADLICASVSYNDASREKAGETSLPEWQLWTSLCDPISQSQSQTWFGQQIASSGQPISYIASVGGRVYPTKDLTGLLGQGGLAAKLQPYVEVGGNKTAPFDYSAHAYVGLRTTNKVFGCGVGPHYSDVTNTTVPGLTCTYDIGRHVKLTYEQERWSAMVRSLEALGVAVEDD